MKFEPQNLNKKTYIIKFEHSTKGVFVTLQVY